MAPVGEPKFATGENEMNEMNETTERPMGEGQEALNRRDMLRRVAVVGAATVWTVPMVQRLGMVAAAAVSPVPPPPPPPPPPGGFVGISYLGLVFLCGGTYYRAKWEEGAGSDGWADHDGDSLPQCPEPNNWDQAIVYDTPAAIGTSKTYVGGELYSVTFTIPAGCTATGGSGLSKGGNPNNNGFCLSGVISLDGTTVTFTAPTTT